MNMLEQLFGIEFGVSDQFRANPAHPLCASRRRLLRYSTSLQSNRGFESPYLLTALLGLSLLAVVSFTLFLARTNAPTIEGFSREEVLRQLSISFDHSSVREESLARVNLEQDRRNASVTHFISELIIKHQRTRSPAQAQNIATAIVSESTRLGFDPLFIASVIKYESTFNPLARSPAGAVGLMQMLPSTGVYISKVAGVSQHTSTHLHDPKTNIKLGILYLAYLRSKFRGNKEQMLVAYNWGPENLIRATRQGKAAPGSTIHYARRIMTHYRDWQRNFESQSSRYRHFDFARANSFAKDKSLS